MRDGIWNAKGYFYFLWNVMGPPFTPECCFFQNAHVNLVTFKISKLIFRHTVIMNYPNKCTMGVFIGKKEKFKKEQKKIYKNFFSLRLCRRSAIPEWWEACSWGSEIHTQTFWQPNAWRKRCWEDEHGILCK